MLLNPKSVNPKPSIPGSCGKEVQAFRAAAAAQAEMEACAERNRQLREEEAKLEKPNPLEVRGR